MEDIMTKNHLPTTTDVSRRRLLRTTGALGVAGFIGVPTVSADFGTGDTWPSTNELNRDKEVPGREGQNAPHVNEIAVGPGSVTLEFVNHTNSLAFFEYRTDGDELDEGNHPVVNAAGEHDLGGDPPRDSIYPGINVDGRSEPDPVVEVETFEAYHYVEVRLALGGERDWDFDWTRFYAEQPETKTDCKRGGHADYGFRNQGQCIRYVNTGKDSR